jgi:ketosteroid isomerase-like protein
MAAVTRHSGIDLAEAIRLSEAILAAWNEQDVEKVVACYTEDCSYLDPNTRGPVVGREALRRYLTKLFGRWRMHWSRREAFLLSDGGGTAFLWHAELTPAGGGRTAEIDGMDLALVRDGKLYRNEVYFDRAALFGAQ